MDAELSMLSKLTGLWAWNTSNLYPKSKIWREMGNFHEEDKFLSKFSYFGCVTRNVSGRYSMRKLDTESWKVTYCSCWKQKTDYTRIPTKNVSYIWAKFMFCRKTCYRIHFAISEYVNPSHKTSNRHRIVKSGKIFLVESTKKVIWVLKKWNQQNKGLFSHGFMILHQLCQLEQFFVLGLTVGFRLGRFDSECLKFAKASGSSYWWYWKRML